MPKTKNTGGRGTLEPLSAWKRHQALQELARFMGQEGRPHLTQLEYDLAEEKAYSVQFFVRHWGSWARAVEKARELVDQQEIPEPEPSPYAGWVSCLCGKACHCEKRFWSPDRRQNPDVRRLPGLVRQAVGGRSIFLSDGRHGVKPRAPEPGPNRDGLKRTQPNGSA